MSALARRPLATTFGGYAKNKLFQKIYMFLLDNYYSKNKYYKLKYQSTDTSIVCNYYGIDQKGKNKYAKNKFVNKISLVTDRNGVAFSIIVDKGNINDSTFIG